MRGTESVNDRNVARPLPLPDPPDQRQTILPAKLYIEQDGVRQFRLAGGVTLFQILDVYHFEAFRFQPIARSSRFGWLSSTTRIRCFMTSLKVLQEGPAATAR
jgi:hypothetical protein